MGKKDKKSKQEEKKARVAQKQEKKASQKEKKNKSRGKDADDSDAESVDLDQVLAEYAAKQEQFLKVTETICEPPAPRASSTLLASPSNVNELFLFGGEFYNGAVASFYNELFVYNVKRDEWKIVTSPNTPLPRSGHAWTRGGNAGGIYIFGGEFSSPKQAVFYHYNDFWHLDPASREWTRLEGKSKGPSARSGHRMTYFKNYIVLFGGFQDTSQSTKYLQDVWIYDCSTYTWHNPVLPPTSQRPDARSSCTLLPHSSGAVLYGGYARVKSTSSGKKGGPATKTSLKPVVYQDTWFLRIEPPPDTQPNASPKIKWERRKRTANAPNPPRAGATMAYHKGRGVQFGGVHDVEESEEGIDSEFFNEVSIWNIERNRCFSVSLRRPRAQKKAQVEKGRKGRDDELLQTLKKLQMESAVKMDDDPQHVEEDEPERPQKPTIFEMPHPRFNAQLAVQDDTLYIFGGTYEKGDREFTFDELWALDLGKLDGVKEIYRRELENWLGSDDESDEGDEDEDEDEEEYENEDEEMVDAEATNTAAASVLPTAEKDVEMDDEPQEDAVEAAPNDALPHPRPFESLREFYSRTMTEWVELTMQELSKTQSGGESMSVKELRKGAFNQAEEKWWDSREEISALEDEQTEAGIGEVISIASKGGAGARRR